MFSENKKAEKQFKKNVISIKTSQCEGMTNVLVCDIAVSEFEIQSFHYIHFWTNSLEKVMNSLIPPDTELIVPLPIFHKYKMLVV